MRDLIKKINILSTGNTKSKEANLRETFHYGNKSVFLVIENIKEAMNTNRKLDVTISDYDKNGKLLTKSDPQSGIKLQRVMPSLWQTAFTISLQVMFVTMIFVISG